MYKRMEGPMSDWREWVIWPASMQASEAGPNCDPLKQTAASWLEQNRAALESSNDYVEEKGLPLATHRPY